MSLAAPLLAAKLLPPGIGRYHLPRARLNDRLAAGIEGRATIVLAGPGYGKTSLAARFLQDLGADTVWYRLDPTDRDPWVLLRYLAHGIREQVPEFGERSQGIWEDLRSQSEQAERLADAFIRDAEESLGGRVVLVLDEVQHLAGSAACATALRRLLAYLPGALHLILLGRSLPDLGAHGIVAGESVNLVQGAELLFTVDETRDLLHQTFGLRLGEEAIERVQSRTRGWVTALQLLRQTARLREGAADLPEDVFARAEPEIFDYFTGEVLDAESAEVRSFLLDSAPPPVLDPEICAAVLPDLPVREIVAALVRRNLFLSRFESRGDYYAYDPLFLDFLRRRLRKERGVAGTRDLHRRYAAAYAERADFSQAIAQYIAAEDPKGVARVLSRHGMRILRSGLLGMVREGAQFLVRGGARPAFVDELLGEASRLSGDHAAAVEHFRAALAAPPSGRAEAAGTGRAVALQGLAYSLLKMGDIAAAESAAEEALAAVTRQDAGLVARILNTISIIRYRQNRQEEAIAGWQNALARARQAGDEHLTLMIAHNLGLPHAVAGDFARAAECFRILTGPENRRLGPEEGAAYLNLARIETLNGSPERAAALLQDAREIARKWQLDGLEADVLEAEGNLQRDTGEYLAAAQTYARARSRFIELGQLSLVDSVSEEEALLAALEGATDEAERLAAGCLERRRAAADKEGIASTLLSVGEVRVRAGNHAAAVEPLAEAADLFGTLGRSFQRCKALLWLALARRATGDPRAAEAASDAAGLAVRFDYRMAVAQAVRVDPGLGHLLAAAPQAPAWLREMAAGGGAPPAPGIESGPDLTVRLLGPVEIYRDARRKIPAQAWKIRRALEIFCYLASARDHRATRDRIADAVWGEARPAVIERNFHPTISFLRRALNHGHNVPKNFVLCERGAYLLNPIYGYDIDTERFEAAIRAARRAALRGDAAEALSEYETALALYRGPFLEEEYAEWVEAPRSHCEVLHVGALREAGELYVKAGRAEAARTCFSRLVQHDPLDEEDSVRLMRALGALGNRAAVEKEFNRLTRALEEELAAAPAPPTRKAYRDAILVVGSV